MIKVTRNRFFIFLFLVTVGPLLAGRIAWLARSTPVEGRMRFMGRCYTGQLIHDYPVISFVADGNTIWFNGEDNLVFRRGERVPVRYIRGNPSDARVNVFFALWVDILVYGVIILLILAIVYFHPIIVPRGAFFVLTARRPWIRMARMK